MAQKEFIVVYGIDVATMREAKEKLQTGARLLMQHAQYFDGKIIECDRVVVFGDAPDIVAAYEKAGIPIEVCANLSDDDQDNDGLTIETPEDIDKLNKPDVIEYLAAHGVKDAEGKVGELREQLKALMFTDL